MKIWLIIFGMAAVTYGTRLLPLTVVREEALPTWARRGLAYVPVAQSTWGNFTVDGHLVAGSIAIAVAWYSKNTILTILVGLGILLLLS
jgi:branched-subunit amino acid transport protein